MQNAVYSLFRENSERNVENRIFSVLKIKCVLDFNYIFCSASGTVHFKNIYFHLIISFFATINGLLRPLQWKDPFHKSQ